MNIQMINKTRKELDDLIEKNNWDLGSAEVQEKSRQLDRLVVELQKREAWA